MQPLLNIPKEQIPRFQEIARFPKDSSFFLACFWLSFPIIIILLILDGTLEHLVLGKPFPISDWVPALVILLILLPFTVPYFLQEKRRHKENKRGLHTVGAFFSKDSILWCTSENIYQFIYRSSLDSFELRGRPTSGLNGWSPDWMELRGPDFCVRIEDALDYKLPDLISFFRTWKPDLTIKIDSELDRYLYVPPKD